MKRGGISTPSELFSRLRPTCVQLSQAALRHNINDKSVHQIVDLTTRLLDVLQTSCISTGGLFSPRLADYVFFPLSQVFRICQSEHDRLAELATSCLVILLKHGWQDAIAVDLGKQLIVLLTSFLQRASGGTGPDELQDEALEALAVLFRTSRRDGSDLVVEDEFAPSLGVCLSAVLDGLSASQPAKTQLLALEVLNSFWQCIEVEKALISFLPGTVSSITRCLHPTTRNARTARVLVEGLRVLEIIMVRCLGDIWIGRGEAVPRTSMDRITSVENSAQFESIMSHVKLALSSIVRLKTHKDPKVRFALQRFCLALLDHCHGRMSDSRRLLVETTMILMANSKTTSTEYKGRSLQGLADDHTEVAESIKLTMHAWLSAFPRLMLSLDEGVRSAALANLSVGMDLLSMLKLDTWTISTAMLAAVQEGLVCILEQPPSNSKLWESTNLEHVTDAMTTIAHSAQFAPLLLQHEAQKTTRELLDHLLDGFGVREKRLRAVQLILSRMASEPDANKAASFWLAQKLVKPMLQELVLEEDMVAGLPQSYLHVSVLDELLTHAIQIISDSQSMALLKALALEMVAHSAQMMAMDFRTILIDTLCPIIDCLGSSDLSLREHALTTLDIVASACGYASTGALIVGNVDYLVNYISLQLNTFNMVPEYPQLLVMIIKMTGPSLLPYLDDIVEAISSALANFHGYPSLVDTLFNVLVVMVEHADLLGATTHESSRQSNEKEAKPTTVSVRTIVKAMDIVKTHRQQVNDDDVDNDRERITNVTNSQVPESNRLASPRGEQVEAYVPETTTTIMTRNQMANSKIYTLISNIVRVGQNFLTSSSPSLRRKILVLMGNACAILSTNEDEFLPIVNEIWPPILRRLYDDEAHVIVAAAETLTKLCASAGDFVSTRLSSHWPDLAKLFFEVKSRVSKEHNSGNRRGMYSLDTQVWKAIRGLIAGVISHVSLEDDVFDSALELLSDDALQFPPHYHTSRVNADTVWLHTKPRTVASHVHTPAVSGFVFKSMS